MLEFWPIPIDAEADGGRFRPFNASDAAMEG